ncbi:MAG TPA: hypothetical protein VGR14_17515, partial [Verrucomicrobiae bacterium]|nr:hypothetical protein [Verrucomicrobiae bacterium]
GTARALRLVNAQAQRSTGGLARCPVFKDRDYLADNICFSMLSEVMDRVQEQSDWAARLVPNWELRIALPGSV